MSTATKTKTTKRKAARANDRSKPEDALTATDALWWTLHGKEHGKAACMFLPDARPFKCTPEEGGFVWRDGVTGAVICNDFVLVAKLAGGRFLAGRFDARCTEKEPNGFMAAGVFSGGDIASGKLVKQLAGEGLRVENEPAFRALVASMLADDGGTADE